jgi:hypothetical protein
MTLEAFDVDTTAADTNTAAVVALFRPDRLLGSKTLDRTYFFLDDSLSISIPNAFLLSKIRDHKRVRIGFRFVGDGEVTMLSIERGIAPVLLFDPAPGNTSVASRGVTPISNTPANELLLANDLRDYSLVVKGSPPPTERLAAGGLPAFRAFIRLNIPKRFLDSVVIVRAQLVVVQRPVHGINENDTTVVMPVVVSTTPAVTDVRRAAQLVYPILSFGLSGMVAAPSDSGERRIEMVEVLRQWALTTKLSNAPITAIVLRSANEGLAYGRLAFFGLDAPPALRPKLRLSYVARSRFGIP